MREGEKKLLGQEPDETEAEAILWRRLRDRSLAGHKFRRQHPVSGYVIDFVCLDARLVVELDGGQHDGDVDAASAGTALLERRGFRVLRFWNNEVLADPDGVLETIARALEEQ